MTAILPYEDFYIQQTWDSMTTWLDKIFTQTFTSHRFLSVVEDSLEMLDQELMDMDRSLPQVLPPTQLLAAQQLGLRVSDIETVLYSKWVSAPIRRSTFLALEGIHRRYLGPIPQSRSHTVVFEISGVFHNLDFSGYVQANRLEMHSRWANSDSVFGGAHSLNVVEGPLWVHDVYRHLLGKSLRGTVLRDRYVSLTPNESRSRSDYFKERPDRHLLGEPVLKPAKDILEASLTLWDPHEERSPYKGFAAAVQAAELL
jgi:hypothetical protein